MKRGETEGREDSWGLVHRNAGDVAQRGSYSIQVGKKHYETECQEARSRNRLQVLRSCSPVRHAVLLGAISSPKRENRGPFRAAHQRFGKKGGFTGEWQSQGGEWRRPWSFYKRGFRESVKGLGYLGRFRRSTKDGKCSEKLARQEHTLSDIAVFSWLGLTIGTYIVKTGTLGASAVVEGCYVFYRSRQ